MRTPINLATKPFINTRPFLFVTALLGTLALVLTSLVLVQGITAWQEQTSIQGRLRALERERGRLLDQQERIVQELSAPGTRTLLERKAFLDQLIRQRSLSSIELFYDLQEQLPSRVRILSLSPSLEKKGQLLVEMQVGGDSAGEMIEFLETLEKGGKFRDVVLHSQRQGSARQDALIAELSAVYVQE